MKQETIDAVCAALSISFSDDAGHFLTVLRHFTDVFGIGEQLEELTEKAEKFQTFWIDVKIVSQNLSIGQNVILIVIDQNTCTQHLLKNGGSVNRIEIPKTGDVSIKFILSNSKRTEGSSKGVTRSSSLLKKMALIRLDKKHPENVQINNLPIGSNVKKTINFGSGKNAGFEIKLQKSDHRKSIKQLEFFDFLEITRTVHEWQATNVEESELYDGSLGDPTFSMFYSIAFFFEIPSFVLKVAELACFLVWDDEKKKLDEKALIDVSMKMTACATEVDLKHALLIPCLTYLHECTTDTIKHRLNQYQNEPFFPPISFHRLKPINDSLKIITDICVLGIWDDFPDLLTPANDISESLRVLLFRSAQKWSQSIEGISLLGLCSIVHSVCSKMNSEFQSYHLFFQQFDINYVAVTLSVFSEKLDELVKPCLQKEKDFINLRNYSELETFTKNTMHLFVNVRKLTIIAEQFRLIDSKFASFEEWFLEIIVFWTYSWREVTFQMVERTIRLDEDGDSVKYGARRPLPAGLYSFLCIQKGISDDMKRLEFTHPTNLVISSASVINILCQNINAYAKKLFNEAMRTHEEKPSRLVRATNGIEQAMCFVEEGYRRFAQFQRLEDFVGVDEVQAVQTTANRLLKTTREMCEQQISTLLFHFVQLKADDIAKIAKDMCIDAKEAISGLKSYMREVSESERFDETLERVYGLIDDIRCLLLPNCFKLSTKHFASSMETELRKNLKPRQPAEYYGNIYIALKCVYEILEMEESKDIDLLSNLHLNSFSTNDLILSYYDSLCEKIERTNFNSVPTVDVQISYTKNIESNSVTIRIKLLKMSPTQLIDVLSERVDYFARIELLPKILFPTNKFDSPTTNPVPQSTRPQWKQIFEINVPLESFFIRGSCLSIAVFDHERFVDRLIGRGLISLHSVPLSCDEKPWHQLQVALLPNDYLDHSNVFYQLLKSRSPRDGIAKEFIETRQKRNFRIGDIQRYFRRNRSRFGNLLLG